MDAFDRVFDVVFSIIKWVVVISMVISSIAYIISTISPPKDPKGFLDDEDDGTK